LSRKLVATVAYLEGLTKNNVRSFICRQRSTNPAYFLKIGPVDVEIIGVKEITNNVYFKKQQRNLSMRGSSM